MSYSSVSHVAHDSYPQTQGDYPGSAPPPPPPPRPGFEQGYGFGPGPRFQGSPGPGPGPGYQGYFSDNYPPQVAHVRHSGPTHYPYQQQQPYDNSYDYGPSGCPSLLRACMATLCCCCILEQCCSFW